MLHYLLCFLLTNTQFPVNIQYPPLNAQDLVDLAHKH